MNRERARFERYVDRSDLTACWTWTGSTDNNGYGQLNVERNGRRSPRKAHRVAWELHHQVELRPGQCVLHHCDTPSCVRVDHLFVGSVHDNNTDMTLKGRHAKQVKQHCPAGHPFAGATTTGGARICRICRREANRRYRARKAAA